MKFQDDISNMNTYTHTHTYIRTSRNQYVPHFFKVGGIKKIGGVGGGSGVGGGGGGGGLGRGLRVDVNEELEFLGKFTKKKIRGGGGGGGGGSEERGGQVGGEVGLVGGVRVDVNAMLRVGGDVGYGGCEPRIEGIVQCTKRYCTILRK